MEQGCKLDREELLFPRESHARQPGISPVFVLITTKAADKQPNQNDSSKSQQSYKEPILFINILMRLSCLKEFL